MSLRYIVPALGLITFTSGALVAADSPVSIGGFVDAIGAASDTQDDGDSTEYNMQAAAEVRLGYKIGEKVGAKLDLEWNNNESGSYNGHPNTYVEQAFINYAVTDVVSVTGGKFTSYAGWVAADADGLYRVNGGPVPGNFYGTELVGAAVNVAPTKEFGISMFLVNGLGLIQTGDRLNDNPDDNYLSPAIDAVYTVDGLGSFNVEFGYDYHGPDLSAWALGLNTTIKAKGYEPLTVGAELLIQQIQNDLTDNDTDKLGAVVMANHTIPNKPMSVTLMGQYMQTKEDATDAEPTTLEVALALLTNPTGDSKFGLNFEIAYRTDDADDGSDNTDSLSGAVELLAVVP